MAETVSAPQSQPQAIVSISNGEGSAIASLIISIIGILSAICLVFFAVPFCALPFSFVSIGLSLFSYSKTDAAKLPKNTLATIGLVISILTIVACLCMLIFGFGVLGIGMLGSAANSGSYSY